MGSRQWVGTAALLAIGLSAPPVPAAKPAVSFVGVTRQAEDGLRIGEVSANGCVLLRLRSKSDTQMAQRAEEIARRLGEVATEGVTASDIAVHKDAKQAKITARGRTLVTVDAETAKLSASTSEALANQWAAGLKGVFGGQYFAVGATEMVVPFGESRSVPMGGTAKGPISVQSADESVAETLADTASGRVNVWGHDVGETQITLTRGGFEATIRVQVKKWAARLIAEPTGYVTGGKLTPQNISKVALNAARSALAPEPGAQVDLAVPDAASQGATSVTVDVSVDGPGFLPVRRALPVRVHNKSVPVMTAERLLVSNEPENVTREGILAAGTLWPLEPTRLLYHHKNVMGRRAYLVLSLANTGDTTASVHIIESIAGPDEDELFVGHLAAARFIADQDRAAGYILNVPPGRSCEIAAQSFPANSIASAVLQINVLDGPQTKVLLKCADQRSSVEHGWFPVLPPGVDRIPLDGQWVFAGKRLIEAHHTVGENWTFISVGKEPSEGELGETLHGDYGVMYYISALVSNPTHERAKIELALRSGGGAARGVFIVQGRTIETGVVQSGTETVIWHTWLDAGAKQRIGIRTMPESASTYPVQLVIRGRR